MEKINAYGYFFVAPNQPLERREFAITEILPGHVAVEVAGCGLCHTDLSFYTGSVKTKQQLPLILGHEISGKVVRADGAATSFAGKNVVIPAVLPCGECELCRCGRSNVCQNQKMPGNDFHGGFASHIVAPVRFLCALPEQLGRMTLPQMSVIADAVTTPYMSMMRSGLKRDDVAIVIGTGGIGTYMVQHAKNTGAHVIALDIDDRKLARASAQGAEFCVNCTGLSEKDVRDKIRKYVSENKLRKYLWKIFETSGTAAGQNTAFSLLGVGATLAVVGFTGEKLNLRLSNVMAFDADIFGNWGCKPEYYPEVVNQVLDGRISLIENVEEFHLNKINEVFQMALGHKLEKRAVLKPS